MEVEERRFAHSPLDDAPRALPETLDMRRRRYVLRRALVELAAASGDPETTELLSLAAGAAATALAESGDSDGLAQILRPDPVTEPAAWTVACYEIGQLTPSALRDLSDPAEAVNLVGACPESRHIAAELVVSTATGLRWTVLVRAGSALRLRLPSQSSAEGRDDVGGALAAAAHHRWQEELAQWSVEPEPSEVPGLALSQTSEVAVVVSAALERAAALHAAETEAIAIRHAAELQAALIRGAADAAIDLERHFAGLLEILERRLDRIEEVVRSAPPPATPLSLAAIWSNLQAQLPPRTRRFLSSCLPRKN